MSQELPQTKRQEWSIVSSEVQRDVNGMLHDVQLEIEAANVVLDQLYKDDPDGAGEYAQGIVEYLDELWKYHHDYFMVTGRWHEPTYEVHGEGLEVRHVEKEAFHPVRSNGFMVKPVEDDDDNETVRVGMSFIMGDVNYSSPYFQGAFQILAFAEPGTISLQYLRPGDTSIVSTEVTEVADALLRADSLLYLHTNHPNSQFYELSRKRQQKFLQSLLTMVEEVMPAPDSMDAVIVDDLEAPLLFFKSDETDQLVAVTAKDNQMKIGGQVMGVTIADLVYDKEGVQYASMDDFDAHGMGLCLIVKLHKMNFPIPDGMAEKELLVPLRYAKNMSLQAI